MLESENEFEEKKEELKTQITSDGDDKFVSDAPSNKEKLIPASPPILHRTVKKRAYPILMAILITGMLANGFLYINSNTAQHSSQNQIAALKSELANLSAQASDPAQGAGFLVDFTNAVNKVEPAVVVIEATIESTGFFGQPITGQDSGTGWIVDSSGLIVTNEHVIDGATSIAITLADGRTFQSVAVQSDVGADLAVIKINTTGLPTIAIGDSSTLAAGQPVAAIGNALDLGISITGGLISRLDTSLTFSDGSIMNNLIETDAAINPGNSGGPLINVSGEIVGITNAKLVETGLEGIGYAITINSAMNTIDGLIAKIK